ncbi:MAG: DnaJ domain-containing protein, partial [Xanthomonadaceae bacterium]|nr:DnaJ domain-containing protein [Xanthomonadaceae bacterium]
MEFKDYYKVLGVEPGAGEAEIKQAFRRLARRYHPDVSKEKGAEDRFKAVNEAYEVLRDKEKRAEYDAMRAGGFASPGGFRPPPGPWPASRITCPSFRPAGTRTSRLRPSMSSRCAPPAWSVSRGTSKRSRTSSFAALGFVLRPVASPGVRCRAFAPKKASKKSLNAPPMS